MEKVRLLIVFLLFGLAIIFLPFMHNAFELPKIFFLYFICSVSLCILLAKGYGFHDLKLIHKLYLFFLTWIIISSIFGLSFSQSFWGSYFRMQGILTWICYSVLFFISGSLFVNAKFRILASIAITMSSIIAAFLATFQFFSLWFLGNTSQVLYDNRIISTFGQPNFLGAFLVMSLPFAWYLYSSLQDVSLLSSRGALATWRFSPGKIASPLRGLAMTGEVSRNDVKFTLWLSIVLIIIVTIFTFSRSAYLGIIILLFIWGFHRLRLALVVLASIISVFVLLLIFLPSLANQQLQRFKVDTLSQWTAENRIVIAQKAIELIAKRPISGYGLENFSSVFPAVVKPQDFGLDDIVVDSAHNLFLDLWVQTGLIGLGLFLAIFILSIAYGLKTVILGRSEATTPESIRDSGRASLARMTTYECRNFTKALICVIISFVIIHQFSVLSVVPLTIFWISMGAINGSVLDIKTPNRHSGLSRIYGSFGVILIMLVGYLIIQTIRANYYFHQASAYEVTDINKAISLDNKAIRLAPWVSFYSVRRDFLVKQLGKLD